MNSSTLFMAAVAMSAGCSALLVHFMLRHAPRLGMVATPGERQSHSTPTPSGAGVGIILALIIVSALIDHFQPLERAWLVVALPAIAVLSLIGALDDRAPVSALLRLAVQFAVSLALLGWVHEQLRELASWEWVVAAIGAVWVMNAYNFMDGSDGMAGFQGVFAGLALCLLFLDASMPSLALPALLLAGVCAGFLPMNVPVAKIFMGDSGSVPLGFGFAALIGLGISHGALTLSTALMVLSVFLVDSTLTLFKRVIKGERWYTAHKQHVYQRLIDHGWPHSRVLLFYQATNLLLVAPAIWLARTYPDLACVLAGALILLLITGWYAASLRLGVRK